MPMENIASVQKLPNIKKEITPMIRRLFTLSPNSGIADKRIGRKSGLTAEGPNVSNQEEEEYTGALCSPAPPCDTPQTAYHRLSTTYWIFSTTIAPPTPPPAHAASMP